MAGGVPPASGLDGLAVLAARHPTLSTGIGTVVALALGIALAGPGVSGFVLALIVGMGMAAASTRLMRRQAMPPATDPRVVIIAADLMAACLDAGCSEVEALQAVAAALGERTGHRFAQVAGALRMGLPAEDAWRPLAEDRVTAPLAHAACRVVRTGAPLAGAVSLVADDARALRRSRAREAVRRAGVTAMAPLGGCFLPAFLILAIVPVIAGLMHQLIL